TTQSIRSRVKSIATTSTETKRLTGCGCSVVRHSTGGCPLGGANGVQVPSAGDADLAYGGCTAGGGAAAVSGSDVTPAAGPVAEGAPPVRTAAWVDADDGEARTRDRALVSAGGGTLAPAPPGDAVPAAGSRRSGGVSVGPSGGGGPRAQPHRALNIVS